MSDFIGIRGSAKDKAEDAHNAKAAAFHSYLEELHGLRTAALGRIVALADQYGTSPVPNDDLRAILRGLDDSIYESLTRHEAKVKLIEEAYK